MAYDHDSRVFDADDRTIAIGTNGSAAHKDAVEALARSRGLRVARALDGSGRMALLYRSDIAQRATKVAAMRADLPDGVTVE